MKLLKLYYKHLNVVTLLPNYGAITKSEGNYRKHLEPLTEFLDTGTAKEQLSEQTRKEIRFLIARIFETETQQASRPVGDKGQTASERVCSLIDRGRYGEALSVLIADFNSNLTLAGIRGLNAGRSGATEAMSYFQSQEGGEQLSPETRDELLEQASAIESLLSMVSGE